ncbi:MAG: hypothetical protein ABGZ24_14960, partial [Fuerstiella sp.]
MRITFSVFCLIVVLSSAAVSAADPPGVIDIGSRRELFVDDLLIGKLDGTRLKMHSPQLLQRMPPRPFGHYATVLKDS